MQTDTPLQGRIALVTGASRGIGQAVALGLAKAGAHVIATARTQGGLEALDDEVLAATGERATLVPLDIKDGKGIDQLGRAIYDRWGKLDILFSCAGDLGLVTPVAHLEPNTWERAVAVNMTANYRLIRSMDPLLRAAEAGRAVFVTSGIAQNPHAFWGPYAATKAGLEALVRCYADEAMHTNVRCALLSPGPMRTRMRAAAFPGEDPDDLPPPEAIVPLAVDLVRADKTPPTEVVSFTAWSRESGASGTPTGGTATSGALSAS
jgi:NAD(P)-dependent dehydrogenase (short-subunit alcohol dehydrogenase family)